MTSPPVATAVRARASGHLVPGLCVAALCLLCAWPACVASRFNILDCAPNYEYARQVNLLDTSTYLFMPLMQIRAQPFFFLLWMPAYVATSATLHFWYQTLLFLILPCLLMYLLVVRVSGRRWYAVVAVVPMMCHPSFIENYYTLIKPETYILAGTIASSWILWRLMDSANPQGRLSRIAIGAAGLGAALLCYTVKETGGAFLGVYCCGIVLMGWAAQIRWRSVLARTWWLTVFHGAAFTLLVCFFLRLKTHYSVGGQAEYSMSVDSVVPGMVRLATYFLGTASYLVPSLMTLCAALPVYMRLRSTNQDSCHDLRVKIAGTAYFILFFMGMVAPLAPWTSPDPRYFLVGASGGAVCAVLAIDVGWWLTCRSRSLVAKIFFGALTAATALLLMAHVAYAILVGWLAEAPVRHRFDLAYDGMFRYVARHTPTNGTAYFMMDWRFPEPQSNTMIGMRIFYGRPDITCVFPRTVSDFDAPGLVAVSDYSVPFNYDRMPVQHEANAVFYRDIAPHLPRELRFEQVYSTRAWYATNVTHGAQYESVCGIPAFWKLKRGLYRFGWHLFAVRGSATAAPPSQVLLIPPVQPPVQVESLMKNGRFEHGMAEWSPWLDASKDAQCVRLVDAVVNTTACRAIRLSNPRGQLLGIQQLVNVESGAVYRMSGWGRGVPGSTGSLLGGRLAFFVRGQDEQHLVWYGLSHEWTRMSSVFTNFSSGTAVVYVHMGFGSITNIGEFTDMRIEKLECADQKGELTVEAAHATANAEDRLEQPCALVRRASGQVASYTSVWQALRSVGNNDVVELDDRGVGFQEAMCYVGHPLRPGVAGVRILGKGSACITVHITEAPAVNECALELSGMTNLYLSNVVVRAVCHASALPRVYTTVFNACDTLTIERCTLVAEVHGTANTFKTFVATAGARNVVVRDSALVTIDFTGSNDVYHTATHDAEPALFQRVWFLGRGIEDYKVGKVTLDTCFANDRHFRTAGTMIPGTRSDALRMVHPSCTSLVAALSFEEDRNLLRESSFLCSTSAWSLWAAAKSADTPSLARMIDVGRGVLRIANAGGVGVGVQQMVPLVSGAVYRLEGVARSVTTNASDILFGGRVAVFLPPQTEKQLVWMGEYTAWWPRALVFTNTVSGMAIIYAHLGFGNVASTGEFADVRLEHVE